MRTGPNDSNERKEKNGRTTRLRRKQKYNCKKERNHERYVCEAEHAALRTYVAAKAANHLVRSE
jgi:hypothetical protein